MKSSRSLVTLCGMGVLLFALSCKGKVKVTTAEERAQLAECVSSMEASADAAPEMRVGLFVNGCGRSLGVDKILEAGAATQSKLIAEKTDYLCNSKAAKATASAAPEQRSALLVEICGADYYGLTKDTSHHLSFSWFLAQRSADWLAGGMSRLRDKDRELAASLEKAMVGFEAPLPVPAQVAALYQLPQSTAPADFDALQYLLVDTAGLKVVNRPTLRLTDKGAVLVDPRAQGKAMAAEEAYSHLRDSQGQLQSELDEEKKRAADEEERLLKEAPRVRTFAPRGDPASWTFAQREALKKGAMDAARRAGVLDSLAGAQTDPLPSAPLLVADRELPAQRVLAVVDAMHKSGVHLGVGYLDEGARTKVSFARRDPRYTHLPNPHAQILLRDDALEIWLPDKIDELARKPDGSYPYDALGEALQTRDELASAILVSAKGKKATYRELIAVLDTAHKAGIQEATTGPKGAMLQPRYRPGYLPELTVAELDVDGDSERDTIARYLDRKIPRMRHCYQRELLIHPALAGLVKATFEIRPTGLVDAVSATDLEHKNLGRCIVSALKSIQFPKPKGGGTTNVSYSFKLYPMGTVPEKR